MNKVLNVGGNDKRIPLPPLYQGWEHILLDIDPKGNPDIVCDARELENQGERDYDAVYCSHNLEHYYIHDVPKVLRGFKHVLKDDGFADVRVPDLEEVMRIMISKGMDLDDILYESPAGPISVRDVIYGLGVQIERSGCDFFAHKTGFTTKSLNKMLRRSGFSHVYLGKGDLEIRALAFKESPPAEIRTKLGLPATG